MIKNNEIRLGNYLNYMILDSVKQGQVTTVTKKRLVIDEISSKYLCAEPIPINEEWLIKLGFKKRNERLFTLNYFEIHMVNKLLYFESYKLIPLYFIHQLQNIYFISEGVELELSSKVA